MRNSHSLKIDLGNDLPVIVVIEDNSCLRTAVITLVMMLNQQSAASLALLDYYDEVVRSNLAYPVDRSIVLTSHASVWSLIKQVPKVDAPSLVSCCPSVEVFQEVNVGLKILADRSGRDRFFIFKVIEVIPKL
jgi:hypothetical protein